MIKICIIRKNAYLYCFIKLNDEKLSRSVLKGVNLLTLPEERLEIQAIADDITSKYVPPHVNIFYCLGGITFTCFIIQVATGFAMTFYYRPTVTEAFLLRIFNIVKFLIKIYYFNILYQK